MILRGINGKRARKVADAVVYRVINHIANNPGYMAKEYAEQTSVAEVVINLIIENHLMHMVNAGCIVVSNLGAKPYWYHLASNPEVIPVRSLNVPPTPQCDGITNPDLNPDYQGLIDNHERALRSNMSPAKRREARQQFVDRVNHVGSHHQEMVESYGLVLKQLGKMKEEISMMASTIMATIMKEPV